MQKEIIGCRIPNFDNIRLSICKNENIIYIYRWTHWATCWQPIQFRQVRRVLSHHAQIDGSGWSTTRPPICQWFGSDLDPDPKSRSRSVANSSSLSQPMIVDDSAEWDVDWIPGSKQCCWTLHNLIQWAGYSYVSTSWEPAENLGNEQDLVDEFHYSRKPWRWSDFEECNRTSSIGFYYFLLSYGSQASINGVGMGFYHLPLEVEFPCALNQLWGCS